MTFTIEAFKELSIPGGTYVSFYLNDPEQFGATNLLTWQIPCSIVPDSSETFTVTLPIDGPSHIYAVLNDDGSSGFPIQFPITDLEEVAYSNNIDDDWICIGDNPSIQAIKYATTPSESCDTIINYIINVCNISMEDATGVIVEDQAPEGFVLVSSVANLNDCAVDNNGSFDIPGECCLSLSLTYDASGASLGYYGDQDVILYGPLDQDYFGYDGASSTAEDVILDGTIDCPSTLIEFIKEVNVSESCDDAFLTFTFTINNELNYPLQGLVFTDIVALPSMWVFEPYNMFGLSIGTKSINQNSAQFIIDEVDAATVATFSFDLSLGMWEGEDLLLNNATLDNVPDAENGGTRTLTSNTTTSQIFGTPIIEIPDTLSVNSSSGTVFLDALYSGSGTVKWTSFGDGTFIDSLSAVTQYIFGTQDLVLEEVLLNVSIETECDSIGKDVLVLLETCEISILEFDVGECDDNDTDEDSSDDIVSVSFIIDALNPGLDSTYNVIIGNDTIQNYTYGEEQFISLPADGSEYNIIFEDSQFHDCTIFETVIEESCSDPCALDLVQLLVTDCDDNDTPDDNSDDSFVVNFVIGASYPGLDSTYFVILGNDTIYGFSYYEDEMIIVDASNNLSAIQFIDSLNENCLLSINVGIESCIYPCELSAEEFIVSDCDDNGTPSDGSDDLYTVTFNISAEYPGVDSSYFVIINSDTFGEFPYDVEQMISLPADGLDNTLDFVDNYFSDCILTEIVNVASCSNPCELNAVQWVVSECDDNGTPTDESDDFFLINFNITASNPGLDSTYLMILEGDTLGLFPYGNEQELSIPANGNEYNIQLIDSEFGDCIFAETVSVESCSNQCELYLDQFIVSECDDNETGSDSSDDTYTITFEVSAANPGIDSTFRVILDNDTIGTFAYDVEHMISLQANDLEQIVTFVDTQFDGCNILETLSLVNCSNECEIYVDYFDIYECDNNETTDDKTDDTYSINFGLSILNSGMNPSFYVYLENDSLGEFTYDMDHSILLPANGLEQEIRFVDAEFEFCNSSQMINLADCSEQEVIEEDFFVPNIFSPNNDGNNDTWTILFFNNIQIISCIIYDRWGNRVYSNTQGQVPKWDGTYNGKDVSQGVYVYKFIYQDSGNNVIEVLGDITLLR